MLLLAGIVVFGALYGSRPDIVPKPLPEPSSSMPAAFPSASKSEEIEITKITLAQDGSIARGTDVRVTGNTITISQGGSYSLEGALENGQIYVETGRNETVSLLLSGVSISNDTEADIHIENAGQAVIALEEGSENKLQSGQAAAIDAVDDTADQAASGAALYARDDLSITGAGSLQVYGYINNGIHTTNRLRIDGGTILVQAKNNGIKGKDSVQITNGDFSILSGGDGIKSDDLTGEGYGTVSITGGTFSIQSEADGIQAETSLEISGR